MTIRKRSRVSSRTASSSRRRSRAASWRSSKSTTDSRRLAAAYSAPKRSSSSCRRSRSRAASSSSAARSAALRACSKDAARAPLHANAERSTRRSGGDPLRRHAQHLAGISRLRGCCRWVGCELLGLDAERSYRAVDARALPELEDERPPGRAKRLVDAREHASQPGRAIGREQPQPLRILSRTELPERALERFAAQHRSSRVLELAEAWVEAGRERMGAQEPVAEPVNRRDPGSVELPREVGTTALAQRRSDPGRAARRPPCACT